MPNHVSHYVKSLITQIDCMNVHLIRHPAYHVTSDVLRHITLCLTSSPSYVATVSMLTWYLKFERSIIIPNSRNETRTKAIGVMETVRKASGEGDGSAS